ncbi:hypothetical protein OE88DRAFT_1668713 [Heliocybe sulcata]|uniref:Uncharacterized protein n=1 Tax=Heliocybe sulcata TaxID=5364 RepID=A0A5C3MWM4_9AGAM|nr:hypothetical protein OE88DRAFT_1668713 [Heliocybe sulcata]
MRLLPVSRSSLQLLLRLSSSPSSRFTLVHSLPNLARHAFYCRRNLAMLERVEKRVFSTAAEQQEELGLEEEMKEVTGVDEAATERDNDSDLESGLASEGDSDESANAKKQKATEDEDGEGGKGDDIDVMPPSTVPFTMTIADVLSNPIYLYSLDPKKHACVVCPGPKKLFKTQERINVHLQSSGHNRRLRRFVEAAGQPGVDQNVDPRAIVTRAYVAPPPSLKHQKIAAIRAANKEKKLRQLQEKKKYRAEKQQRLILEAAERGEEIKPKAQKKKKKKKQK